MKARIFILATLLATGAGAAVAQDDPAQADAITGVWQTESGGYVQIYDAGNNYVGKVVGSADGQARYDTENPDEDKRGRRLLGVQVLHDLTYEGDHTWGGGEIYDPNSGNSYSLKATLHGPRELEVRGYMGISLLGKSQTWTPVPLDAPNLENDLLVGKLGADSAEQAPSSATTGATQTQ